MLLAAMPAEQLRRFLARADLWRFTDREVVEAQALTRQLDEVRRDGIAFDDGEFDVEVRCVAVPVHDFAGRVAGAIGISVPVWRMSLRSLQDKARQVRAAAAELSGQLGFRAGDEGEPVGAGTG